MITLKNGHEISYDSDFDVFFRNILESIILESKTDAEKEYHTNHAGRSLNDLFLKELMDNAILVTHQLFELGKEDEDLAKFMVTGFIFNSIIMSLGSDGTDSGQEDNPPEEDDGEDGPDVIH